jgi:hypothetical protein
VLTDDNETLEYLLTKGSGSRGEQTEATALIDEKIGNAMNIVRRLDTIARIFTAAIPPNSPNGRLPATFAASGAANRSRISPRNL